ncbi:hypothetical protein BKA67DRAFT_579320 [Truncatella angustata]|uniref:Uncharacterized protein n=1 Tax=Truncatella angustata TaxID=152316 RepID=A0A9P8ZSL3_9PEZI|nr:uncharacterized protein BKA67DRAFT_579320 [Truncatella angustata]KAH6648062.1 hypothetical protein BKA67DRAFT_579320 [Truncatella angustata]
MLLVLDDVPKPWWSDWVALYACLGRCAACNETASIQTRTSTLRKMIEHMVVLTRGLGVVRPVAFLRLHTLETGCASRRWGTDLSYARQ